MRPALFLLFLLFLAGWLPTAQAQSPAPSPVVQSVSPSAHGLRAEATTPIVIQFDQPMDLASFGANTVSVMGRWSGMMPGIFSLEDGHTRARFLPARPFHAGERVTVSLARGLQTLDGAALARGYAWQFWIAARPATLDLTEVARLPIRQSGEGWIQSYGAYGGDLDGDGFPDLAVPNERTNDLRVFMNDGLGGFGSFTVYPIPGGARPSPSEAADFDGDGDLDLAVGNTANSALSVFLGRGDGTFSPAHNYTGDTAMRGLAVLDLEGDGFPDLAAAHRFGQTLGGLVLFRNDGTGHFTPTARFDAQGHSETAAEAADTDGDGLLDLIVGALESEEIIVLRGDGLGGVAFHAKVPSGGASWMIATGDLNGDGFVDVASANSSDNHATVLLGDGEGSFGPPTFYPTGVFPLAIDLGDLDGDGDLDLITSNFGANNDGTWTLYENAGDGTFGNPRTLRAAGAGSCAVLHDRDRDGTLDITGIDELADLLFLFANTAAPVSTEASPPPTGFGLDAAFPNPFAETTALPFRLAAPATVRLIVYDALGRDVRRLAEGLHPAGTHRARWDGRTSDGRAAPPGVYLVRLTTPTGTATRRLVRLP